MGLSQRHFQYVRLLIKCYNTSDHSRNQRMSEPLGLLELEASDSMLTYPALIRVSPWLNVLILLLLGILFFLSVAYRMELKFFCLAQHPFYISLTSIPSVDSMTQPPIHTAGHCYPRHHSTPML